MVSTRSFADLFSKDVLQKFHLPAVKKLCDSASGKMALSNLENASFLKALFDVKKTYTKPELIELCSFIYNDEKIFKLFVELQPAWFGVLIETLLWKESVSKNECEMIVGIPLAKSTSSAHNLIYLDLLHFFKLDKLMIYYGWSSTWEDEYNKIDLSISLHTVIRETIRNYYPKPEGYELTPLPEIKDKSGLTLFNAEATIQHELPLLLTYYLQDKIKYSEKGRPNPGGMRKVQKTLALKEFYDDEKLNAVRTMLLCGGIKFYSQKKAPTLLVHEIIKLIFEKQFTDRYSSITNFIINNLKGLNYLYGHEYKNEATKELLGLLKQLAGMDGWFTVKNIITRINADFLDVCPVHDWDLRKLEYDSPSTTGYNKRIGITTSNKEKFVTIPFIKGYMYLLASFGLLEISYKSIDTTKFGKTWWSEYDSLEVIKFTQLGKYVLGIIKTYSPPETENKSNVIFENDNLFIRVEGNVGIVDALLGNFIEKVSANRFVFREGLFLKDCKTIKDIQTKIELFKQTIQQKLPDYWEEQFQLLITNAGHISPANDWVVFKLNETNKNLLRIVAQDSVLKKMTIKAEKYYINVPKKSLADFKRRLMELGYFIES